MRKLFAVVIILAAACAVVYAQSSASNKAFFAYDTNGITLAPFNVACTAPTALDPPGAPSDNVCSDWVTLFDVDDALKTSNNGAIEAAVSAECALWTYTDVTATNKGGKSTAESRAGIEVVVLIDGVEAQPGKVVFCDRLQSTGLDVNLECGCTVPGVLCDCDITGTVELELFQRTKNANSFHYFKGPLGPVLHDVVVKARGIVQCFADGDPVACPTNTVDFVVDAQTTAVIGKATLALDEHNNWSSQANP